MRKARTIEQMTDAELAAMVRNSIYAQNARFGRGRHDARFLVVMAVPYGPSDEVNTLPEALDSFAELVQADDWRERSFQVYDHRTGKTANIQREVLE